MGVKKIGLDCRLAGDKHAGIGRYIKNLLIELSKLTTDHEFVLFFYDKEQKREIFDCLDKKNQSKFTAVITKIKHYSLKEQLFLPRIFKSFNLDLLHVPHFNAPIFYNRKIILTIHDLLWHEQKGIEVTTLPIWLYHLKYFAYKFVVYCNLKKAQAILVPAKTIQNNLIKLYPQVKNKIIVHQEGLAKDYLNYKLVQKITQKKQLVYTGSLYPHKNVAIIVQALKKLPNFKLIIIGSRNVFQNKLITLIKKEKLEKQVQFLGFLSDQQIINIYQESFALIQPSLSEGFGLTGIEAMATNTLVIASDIEIFHEIYNNACVYFNPYSADSLVETIQNLTLNDRKKYINKAKQLVSQYSFENMTRQVFSTYQQILK